MSLADIDIAVLCGGQGSRLRPLLGDKPKVLATVAHSAAGPVTYLDWLIDKVKQHGARRLILLGGIGGDKILDHFVLHPPDIAVNVHLEARQEGTAAAIRKAAHLLRRHPVMIVNGDTLTDADLDVFLARHRGDASVLFARPALSERAYPLGIGVHAGFTLVSPRMLDDIVHGAARDLDTALIGRYMPVSLKDARFLDIGTPERLAKAPEFLREIVR